MYTALALTVVRRRRPSAFGRGIGHRNRRCPARSAAVSLDVRPEALGAFFLGPVLAGIMTGAGDEGLELHHAVLRPDGGNATGALDRLVAKDRGDGLLVLTTRALAPEDVAPIDFVRRGSCGPAPAYSRRESTTLLRAGQ